MNLKEVKEIICQNNLQDALNYFLFRDSIAAFESPDLYKSYISDIMKDFPKAESIIIGGSGNWGYSFNPKNMFRKFSDGSDIDLIIVSEEHFMETWEVIRSYHRDYFYKISYFIRNNLRRHGEDIYSGFITPKWLPDKTAKHYVEYLEITNKHSNKLVKYRTVNLMYFKNKFELLDYYRRSFLKVRKK